MTLLEKLHTPYKLKEIKRSGKVEERNETTAEHTFSAITIAEYFLKKHPKLSEIKVIKLLLYHDYVEIHAGDIDILKIEERTKKEELEEKALKQLEKELPKEIVTEFKKIWKEYLENRTLEAKFAHAIDALDPILQSIHQPTEWKEHGYTEEKLRKYKEAYFLEFPILLKFFNELIKELNEKNIIPKE
ncbi:MAG: HD domain-containing protein [archaeon]|jgi:putative hydrolase of HD superfamily